jgi:3-dehydroquinate dehydratase-2
VINGPNLNLLGKRENEHYGDFSLDQLEEILKKEYPQHGFTFFQSNIEGEIVSVIQDASEKFEAIILNAGGYSHTSVAIKDSLEIINIPKIEVHLSNLAARENFRQSLITASSCDGYISGFKENSYIAAVFLLERIRSTR